MKPFGDKAVLVTNQACFAPSPSQACLASTLGKREMDFTATRSSASPGRYRKVDHHEQHSNSAAAFMVTADVNAAAAR